MDKLKDKLDSITIKIEKHDNIFMFIEILIIASIFLFRYNLTIGDELWNFSNIYKIYNGFIVYKDLNIVQTPLYFYIGNILFKLFGANFLVYRIYEVIIIKTILLFGSYILFKKLGISKCNSYIYTLILIFTNILCGTISTYNLLAILFIVYGLIIEKLEIKNYKKEILQGVIIFLVFLSKQNIGLYYILGIILYYILKKDTVKNKTLYLIKTFAISAICLLMYIIYLYCNDDLMNAVNYVIGGIGEFANQNKSKSYIWIVVIIFYAIIELGIIVLIYNKKINIDENIKNNIKLILCIALFENFIMFPLANEAHFIYTSYLFIIFLLYCMDILMFKDILSTSKIKKIGEYINMAILMIAILILIFVYIKNIRNITREDYYFEKTNPYYGATIDEDTLNNIKIVCEYISEQRENQINVKIISCNADLYINIFKESNGNFDLPFYGNLGKNGEDGLINEINNLNNTKILILTEDDKKYQESKKVTNYIKENFDYQGQIEQFSIYYKE